MKRAYFVVEGPHDVQVIGRLLGRHNLKRVQYMKNLDEYWSDLVPRTFPIQDDLLRRVPMPTFFASEEYSVAVHSAGGNATKISKAIKATLFTLNTAPNGVAILTDADFKKTPNQIWADIASAIVSIIPDVGAQPGDIGSGSPRAGIFVLPDNTQQGTLEDILLPCAEAAYPALTAAVKKFIQPINHEDRSLFPRGRDRNDFKKPAGKAKATVGCIANLLRPGKSMQVSIQDNHWLKAEESLKLPEVMALQKFVDDIIG